MTLNEFYAFIERAVTNEMRYEFEAVRADAHGVLFVVDDRSFLLVVDDSRDGVFDMGAL